MKRNVQRIISILASILMVFNSVPISAFADAEITYQGGLPVAIAGGALTPQQVLGGAVEFGVVADTYKQTGHTETNFAVKHFVMNDQSIEIIGSGTNPIPFYVGQLDEKTVLWNGKDTNVVFDIFINKDQSSKGVYKNHPYGGRYNVEYSKLDPATNVHAMEKNDVNSKVTSLLSHPVNMSSLLAAKEAHYTPPAGTNVIDLTGPMFDKAKNATIYINCENVQDIISQSGWKITKYEGQTIVFNMPGSNVTIQKFDLKVKDENGNYIRFPGNKQDHGDNDTTLTSETGEKDTTPTHNKYVDQYILRHIVFNAYNARSLTINTAAGMFLAPNATVKQSQGAGAGWIVTNHGFESSAEWHFYYHDRHYSAHVEKDINISKTFTYQDGSELPSNLLEKEFTFRMDEVDENSFQIINGKNSYKATVIGKAGETIKFPQFNVSNADFICKQNGEIEGDNQKIYKYYVIQEVSDSDAEIVTDAKKIYVKLEAHGHDKDQIDLKTWYSEDHQNWNNEVGDDGKVGTFNNYKKQYTSVEVEKKWNKAVYNDGQITYVDSTGEHTADKVQVKLIATRELLQQGAVNTPKPTDAPTSVPTTVTEEPTATPTPKPTATPTPTPKPTATPTPTPKPTATPVPVYILRFESSDDSLSVEYKYTGGTKVSFWFDNGNQWWHPYEGIRLSGAVNGTIGNNGNKFNVTMDSNKTIKLTQTGNSNWGNVVTNSLHLLPAPNGNSGKTNNSLTERKIALDHRFFIAASGMSDVSFTPAEEVGPVQSGLESVSSIIGNKEYTVVDTQWLSKTNNWKYKWDNLPRHQYDADGSIYTLTYYIVETTATGAATNSYSGNGTGKVTVTNTEEETSATVTKAWDDSENQDGVRPTELKVDLMNGNTVVATVTLNAANNWTATVEHLQKYSNGQKITYTWNETNLPAGYSFSGDATNGTITTLTNTHTTDKTNVSVLKVWQDNNNQDGIRPDSISVQLKAGDENVGDPVILNADNSWSYEWTDLDKNKNGIPIVYSVDETTVLNDYAKSVSFTNNNGSFSYTITNISQR